MEIIYLYCLSKWYWFPLLCDMCWDETKRIKEAFSLTCWDEREKWWGCHTECRTQTTVKVHLILIFNLMDSSINLDPTHTVCNGTFDPQTPLPFINNSMSSFQYIYVVNGLIGHHTSTKWTSPLSYCKEVNGPFPYRGPDCIAGAALVSSPVPGNFPNNKLQDNLKSIWMCQL